MPESTELAPPQRIPASNVVEDFDSGDLAGITLPEVGKSSPEPAPHKPEPVKAPAPKGDIPSKPFDANAEEQLPFDESKVPKDIKFEDFLDASKGRETPRPKPDEKLEVKPGEKQSQESDKDKPAGKPDARDYSGIDEADVELFKRMSNESFNKLKVVYLEHKQIKPQLTVKDEEIKKRDTRISELEKGVVTIPSNYYEHPNAFVLTPEFSNSMQLADSAQRIQEHWKQQLINIRQGKNWKPLEQDERGQLRIGAEQPATEAAQVEVEGYYQGAISQTQKFQGQLNELATKHKTKHQEAANLVKKTEEEFFPGWDAENHPAKKSVQAVMEKIPPEFRGNPLASFIGKLAVASNYWQQQYNGLVSKIQEAKTKQAAKLADKAKAGPTAADINNGSQITETKSEVTYDMYEKAKRGLI